MKIPIWTWLGFAGAVVSTSDSPDLNSLVEIRKREQKKKKKHKTRDRGILVVQHTFLLDHASQTSLPMGKFVNLPFDNT